MYMSLDFSFAALISFRQPQHITVVASYVGRQRHGLSTIHGGARSITGFVRSCFPRILRPYLTKLQVPAWMGKPSEGRYACEYDAQYLSTITILMECHKRAV